MPVYLHFWGGSIEPCLRQDMEQHSLGLPPTQGPLKCGMGAWQGMRRVFIVWLQSWKHAQGLCFVIFSFQSQGWWRFVFTSLEAFPSTICLLIFSQMHMTFVWTAVPGVLGYFWFPFWAQTIHPCLHVLFKQAYLEVLTSGDPTDFPEAVDGVQYSRPG